MPNDPLLKQLHALPDAEPSDGLWTRLDAARRRQLRRRHGMMAGGAAACALLAAALFFNLDPRFSSGQHTPVASNSATTLPDTHLPSVAPPESLHRIDRELQLAYARNADDAELASLWAVRQDILLSRHETVQPLGI